MVTLGSTKGNEEVLKKSPDLMKKIQDNPDADYIIDDNTSKENHTEIK